MHPSSTLSREISLRIEGDMRFKIKHDSEIETVTPGELATALQALNVREQTRSRVRAPAIITLDGTGAGQDEIYAPPMGFDFELRRVSFELDTVNAANLATGSVSLIAPGITARYLRSGQQIEWAIPIGSTSNAAKVPGAQTWSAEQGPYFRNGEVFEVAVTGFPAGARLTVTAEGILMKGGSMK